MTSRVFIRKTSGYLFLGALLGALFTVQAQAITINTIMGPQPTYSVSPSTSSQTVKIDVSLLLPPTNSSTVTASLDNKVSGITLTSGAKLTFTGGNSSNYNVPQTVVITVSSAVTAGSASVLTLEGPDVNTATSTIQVSAASSGGTTAPAPTGYTISLPFNGTTHYDNFSDYFLDLMKWAINIAEILAVLMVLWGAFKYTTSGGDQSKTKEGKDIIVGALVGFGLLLLIRILIPIIGV